MSGREEFEKLISSSPYEKSISRYPEDASKYAWPGNYKDINVDLAWHIWQAALESRAERKCSELYHNIFKEKMMNNQHQKIKGYRDLTQEEIDLMNRIKEKAEEVHLLIQDMLHMEGSPNPGSPDGTTQPNPRWVNIAQTDLQKGFMALTRSVAKPTTF